MLVELWICPEGHYFGSSSSHGKNLTEEINYEADLRHTVKHDPANPTVVGNRGECQNCKLLGKDVQRTLVRVEVSLPAALEAAA